MKFYTTIDGRLMAQDGGQRDVLVVARLRYRDNQAKAVAYLNDAATKLGEMEPFSDEMAAYLGEVQDKIDAAGTAERFLEDVEF